MYDETHRQSFKGSGKRPRRGGRACATCAREGVDVKGGCGGGRGASRAAGAALTAAASSAAAIAPRLFLLLNAVIIFKFLLRRRYPRRNEEAELGFEPDEMPRAAPAVFSAWRVPSSVVISPTMQLAKRQLSCGRSTLNVHAELERLDNRLRAIQEQWRPIVSTAPRNDMQRKHPFAGIAPAARGRRAHDLLKSNR
jgi:hypothetical protein